MQTTGNSELRNASTEPRRIPITDDAYAAAQAICQAMRRELGGYKPDVSLIVSALTIAAQEHIEETKEVIRAYTVRMFDPSASRGASRSTIAVGPSTEPAACPKRTLSG